MKYIKKLEVEDIIDKENYQPIKRLSYDFKVEVATDEGATIDEIMAEMKEELIKYLEEH